MFGVLTQGFLLGLATAPFCAAACGPVLLPMLLARKEGRLRGNAIALGEFLAGRFVAYAGVGAAAGWLGAHFHFPLWIPAVTYLLLGVALLLYSVSETTHDSAFCSIANRWGRSYKMPVLLGFLTGVNVCPPFVSAIAQAIQSGSAVAGLAYFISFFAATSLVMLPMLVLSFANLLAPARSIARAACGVVGVIFICAAASAFAPIFSSPAQVEQTKPDDSFLKLMIPEAGEFAEKAEPARHFLARSAGHDAGIIVFSEDFAPEVQGFNGPVPVAVAMNMDGVISMVRVMPNHLESPGYFDRVDSPEFLNKFQGKRYSDALTPGKDIDAVTGATISSNAVTETVRLTAIRAAQKIFHLEAKGNPTAAAAGWLNLRCLAIVLFFGISVFGELRRMRWLRYALLALSIIYLGIWQWTFFSVKHVCDIALMDVPSMLEHGLWYLLAVPALFGALFMGRLYCAWMCPFGAVTEFLGRLFKEPVRVSAKWDSRLRWVKYWVLLATLIVYAATKSSSALDVEPFSDLFTFGFLRGGDWALHAAWLLFLLAASCAVFRFFCRYLCPAGAAMAFLSRNRVFGRVRPEGCVECGECGISCPKRGGSGTTDTARVFHHGVTM